jgi:hypothetical protein
MIKYFITAVILFFAVLLSIATQPSAKVASTTADVEKQIIKLQSGTPKQKIKAARKLGEMGPDTAPAVPYLMPQKGGRT